MDYVYEHGVKMLNIRQLNLKVEAILTELYLVASKISSSPRLILCILCTINKRIQKQGLFIALKRSAFYPFKEGVIVGSFNIT